MDLSKADRLNNSLNNEVKSKEDSVVNCFESSFNINSSAEVSRYGNADSAVDQTVSENSVEKESCEAIHKGNTIAIDVQNDAESSDVPVLPGNETASEASNEKLAKAEVFISKPLCADYKSDSDSESVDSESDSSTTETDMTETSSGSSDSEDESVDSVDSGAGRKKKKENENTKMNSLYDDLPLIEDLKITVPEDACVEIGTITSIVETLVVVESFKGSAALDVDTVLFLDNGKKTLGKVFDILGPITEPVYTVRFNNEEQIQSLGIKKSLKVYYAPKTQHTNFVFMSEVLKNRGSDASWKDNTEAPLEYQDFSDDEEERRHKNKQTRENDGESSNLKAQTKPRKKTFKSKSSGATSSRFREPNFGQQHRGSHFQRNPSLVCPPFQRPDLFVHSQPYPPNFYYPVRLPRPSFPAFVNQVPFYQQTTQAYHQRFNTWGRGMFRHPVPPPPPPPPPPADQGDQNSRY